ncbi:hypothetical protein [Leisingera sp. McT4-56]|uniref:hypothetical protein n=1 Tax=Leisingera sp. McT4-56 TaxID=2881255 RepID=UPI001CF8F1BE|nr:hypothetical protein [Leisingera sp. McT4-56]MCB4457401.1 hypothetical protein [Leisingera sp. McT4-56]
MTFAGFADLIADGAPAAPAPPPGIQQRERDMPLGLPFSFPDATCPGPQGRRSRVTRIQLPAGTEFCSKLH